MKIKKLSKVFTLTIALCLMTVSLTACGKKEIPLQEKSEALHQEKKEASTQDTSTQEEPQKTLSDLVSITNVTIDPIDVYSASVDSYDPTQGYVIEATVSNENDISCDVSPILSVVITNLDNYGKEQSKEGILSLSSPAVTSPYCYKGAYGVSTDSVGLAPHETKTVRYYLGANGLGQRVNVDRINQSDEIESFQNLFMNNIISITDAKLQSFNVKESEVVYIPAQEWAKDVSIEEMKFDFSTGNVIKGAVTNNTEDRWKDGSIQFDIMVNGQIVGSEYKDFTFIDKGGVIEMSHNGSAPYTITDSVASYEGEGYKVELIPTLLGYTPDEE
ncbi:hypothetical protein LJC18_03070 [Lachnospiraceae bacterium OttesenSCG-928-E19]|nr:hypothetical protein [Lachnospiraceae bacterium OttesenSCG-928-E19]